MDPVDEPAGVRKRLQHMGYGHAWLPEEPSSYITADWVANSDRMALLAFQEACGLDPSGLLDAATKAELLKRHGS